MFLVMAYVSLDLFFLLSSTRLIKSLIINCSGSNNCFNIFVKIDVRKLAIIGSVSYDFYKVYMENFKNH